METGDVLRETSDGLLRDLDILMTIEEEKRALDPGDPRLVELAARIEEIARRVLDGTRRQLGLTRIVDAQVAAGSPSAPDRPIEEISPRSIQTILAEWRDAERQASAAAPGSADAAEADALVDRLRDEYRRAYEAARDGL